MLAPHERHVRNGQGDEFPSQNCYQLAEQSVANCGGAGNMGGEGRYVEFAVMCTNSTHSCIFQRLACGWLSRGGVATLRLDGSFRHTASVVNDATALH